MKSKTTFLKRPCQRRKSSRKLSKGGQGWVKNYKGSSDLVWGQRPKFSYSLPQAAFCEPLARGLTQLSTSSRACMKTLKQICKGLKSSTKTVHQFSLSYAATVLVRAKDVCLALGNVAPRSVLPKQTHRQTVTITPCWMAKNEGGTTSQGSQLTSRRATTS